MRLPWQNRAGLAKAAAIFASVLLISIGLCEANFLAFGIVSYESRLGGLLIVTGIVELIAMIVGAGGLAAVAVRALGRWIHHRFFPNMQ